MKRANGSCWRFVVGLCWGVGVVVLAGGCGEGWLGGEKELEVAVVTKGGGTVFWELIREGAMAAVAEWEAAGQPVEILWKEPMRAGDQPEQVAILEGLIERGVDGLVVAPMDRQAMVAPVEAVLRAGIPTLVVESALDSGEVVSLVGTDSFRGGELAGEEVARRLGEAGQVHLLRYQKGTAPTEDREAGFLYALAAYPDIEVVSKNPYAGPTRETAYEAAKKVLMNSGGALDAVFTSEGSATSGMLWALLEAGLAGETVFVGFDNGEQHHEALQAGEIDALIKENPYQMGYSGVDLLVRHVRGEMVAEYVDTGVTVVTASRWEEPID